MAVYTIKSHLGLTDFATTGRVLVRAPDGTLWCTYKYSVGTGHQIWVSYSIDNGVTWTEELVAALPGTHQNRPAIAVDSNGDVHVVWYGKGWGANPARNSVQYRSRVAGVWQAQEEVANYASDQERPVIAIDSNDVVHVVFESDGDIGLPATANIAHRSRTAGVWGVATMVVNDFNVQEYPSIAIDSVDNLHVAFLRMGVFGYKRVAYITGTPGAWGVIEDIEITGQAFASPTIALDQSDQPHLAWVYQDWVLTDYIHYSWRLAGVWQPVETLPFIANETQGHPTLAVDMAGNVHAAWSGKGWGANSGTYNVLHLVRDPGGWPAVPEIVIDSANTDFQTNLLWAMYPVTNSTHQSIPLTGYALGYIESAVGSDIAKIILSGDLSWLVAPTVTTDPATNVVAISASLKGTLDNDGGEACEVRFQWGETIAYGNDTPWQGGKHTTDAFEQIISGLTPEQTYHFRAQAKNGAGTANGADRTFTTLIVLPTVTTEPATLISQVSATLNGSLDDDGGEACECGFEWGLDTTYGMTTPTESKVTGQTFSQAIHGLFPGFTYHFRAFATNSVGTAYGADRSFTSTPTFNRAHALSREEM